MSARDLRDAFQADDPAAFAAAARALGGGWIDALSEALPAERRDALVPRIDEASGHREVAARLRLGGIDAGLVAVMRCRDRLRDLP
jgi:hypothetical protein